MRSVVLKVVQLVVATGFRMVALKAGSKAATMATTMVVPRAVRMAAYWVAWKVACWADL